MIDVERGDGDVHADADVRVVNTDSRYTETGTAADRVRAAIEHASHATVYKKVNSTLRGNLVAEIDAAVDAVGAALAVVAPAFPSTRRTTAEVHVGDEIPVDEVRESHPECVPV